MRTVASRHPFEAASRPSSFVTVDEIRYRNLLSGVTLFTTPQIVDGPFHLLTHWDMKIGALGTFNPTAIHNVNDILILLMHPLAATNPVTRLVYYGGTPPWTSAGGSVLEPFGFDVPYP